MEQTFREFGRRYYRWALGAAHQEAEGDFQRLAKMHTPSVLDYLRLMRTAPENLRSAIISSFVKQRLFREFGVNEIDGDTLSTVERDLIDRQFARLQAPIPEVGRFEELEKTRPELFKINRRDLVEKLKRCIQERGEELRRFDSGANWFCSQQIGLWTLRSDFQFGGRFSQFSYWHRITGPNYYQLKGTISIVSWMGITGGASIWEWCTTEELALGIGHAVDACFEFLEAAPVLLASLPLEQEKPPGGQ